MFCTLCCRRYLQHRNITILGGIVRIRILFPDMMLFAWMYMTVYIHILIRLTTSLNKRTCYVTLMSRSVFGIGYSVNWVRCIRPMRTQCCRWLDSLSPSSTTPPLFSHQSRPCHSTLHDSALTTSRLCRSPVILRYCDNSLLIYEPICLISIPTAVDDSIV